MRMGAQGHPNDRMGVVNRVVKALLIVAVLMGLPILAYQAFARSNAITIDSPTQPAVTDQTRREGVWEVDSIGCFYHPFSMTPLSQPPPCSGTWSMNADSSLTLTTSMGHRWECRTDHGTDDLSKFFASLCGSLRGGVIR
jgi:hypothetical protein